MVGKNKKMDIYQEAATTNQYFYLYNGNVLKSLAELMDNLKNMDQEIFGQHVNQKNNDFANWIRDIFGEKELARRLYLSKSPLGMLNTIQKYLAS